MRLIANVIGAVRALADVVGQEQGDRLVAAENERDRLATEVGLLREELANQRETVERFRLLERELLARYGGRRGEGVHDFVVRLIDEREVVRREVAALAAELETCRHRQAQPVPEPECCRTCATFGPRHAQALPGAQGVCQALLNVGAGPTLASVWDPDALPRLCPGWTGR